MHTESTARTAEPRIYPPPVSDAKTHPACRFRADPNPRGYRDPIKTAEIKTSIAATGVHSPVLARVVEDDPDHDLAIVYGKTRLELALEVHGPDYPLPYVLTKMSELQAAAVALVENFHRAPMSPAEEAVEAKRLLALANNDKAQTAHLLGWSRRLLDARLCLTACSRAVLHALTIGQIELGHAELLAGVPPAVQDSVLQQILAARPSVAELKRQLGGYARALSSALFDTGQCTGCPHNSALQAGLFDESLGEGFCQHPEHFDELTRKVLEQKREALLEQYRVVRIVELKDGFTPLPVAADDVGADQYTRCKQCANFGCALSNMPGSQGNLADSLCFDIQCNDDKRRAHRREQRRRNQSAANDTDSANGSEQRSRPRKAPGSLAPRVAEYRLACWRSWLELALIERDAKTANARVLVALMLRGLGSTVPRERLLETAQAIAGRALDANSDLAGALAWVDAAAGPELAKLTSRIAAAASFGMAEADVVVLLNHLNVDEKRYFTLGPDLLNMLTKNEIDGLARELRLDAKLGANYDALRAGDKAGLVAALLAIDGVRYAGLVPDMLRYPRTEAQHAEGPQDATVPAAAQDTSAAERDACGAPATAEIAAA